MVNRQTSTFLKQRMEEAGIRPVSKFGQNFLIDLNLVNMIADSAHLTEQDVALEVGTGTGSLTGLIAQKAGRVITVEIDQNLWQLAQEELAGFNNITFLQQDALRNKNNLNPILIDTIRQAMSEIEGARLKLVANLPYNVATPLISNLLTLDEFVPTSMTVTIQKELAERIVARPGTKDFGALSLWIQAQCNPEIVRIMSPKVFWPRPKVDSAIIHIETDTAKRNRIPDLAYYHRFVRSLFIHRRKLLRGVLVSVFKNELSKHEIDTVLEGINLTGSIRAEQLAVPVIFELCERFRVLQQTKEEEAKV
ncbi:MAG: ribosomal RNA small subunit methyltransferase A [Rhodopirellula sp.]|mgnify:FL=1|nr:ribosomal RNA small subunit methyltransferase A [Rhodopirellula sp.]HCA48753.1 ribosomal RNA small subunit methyltransferase A [Planctomycetaceae bacterium]|tara:strand:+ start:19299 stop:20222 length:924 start_codon:yes stop_codon:yes gene_type:complete